MNKAKQAISHRLKITEGHLKKIIKMNEADAYCIDVLHQIQAVRAALSKIENKVLEHHLATCVQKAFKEGRQNQAIKEVLSVFEKTH